MNFIEYLTNIIELKADWERRAYHACVLATDQGLSFAGNGREKFSDEYELLYSKYCTKNVYNGDRVYCPNPRLRKENIEISIVEEKRSQVLCKVNLKDDDVNEYFYRLKFIKDTNEWKIDKIYMYDLNDRKLSVVF